MYRNKQHLESSPFMYRTKKLADDIFVQKPGIELYISRFSPHISFLNCMFCIISLQLFQYYVKVHVVQLSLLGKVCVMSWMSLWSH